ncbi:hypothetical protein TNCV_54771 [Trichonephila clavipes]|nr:hypothetical protein TNCV_54771 [Trichonephila clavipes]
MDPMRLCPGKELLLPTLNIDTVSADLGEYDTTHQAMPSEVPVDRSVLKPRIIPPQPAILHHRNDFVQWCSFGGNGYLVLSILKSGENQTANKTWTCRKTSHESTVVVSTMHALYSRLIAGDSELRLGEHI